MRTFAQHPIWGGQMWITDGGRLKLSRLFLSQVFLWFGAHLGHLQMDDTLIYWKQ